MIDFLIDYAEAAEELAEEKIRHEKSARQKYQSRPKRRGR